MPRGHKGEPKTPGSGRKPMFTSVEEMQEKIDAYFEDCKGHLLTDPADGKPLLDKWGHPVVFGDSPPTITGLALALGFTNRNALLKYQAKKEFTDCVQRAKARVEAYCESRLFDRDGANGARFSLQCNFKWSDAEKKDGEGGSGPVVKIVCDIPREAPTPGATPAPTVSVEVSEEGAATQSGGKDVSADA